MSVRVAGNYALLTFHTDRRVQKTGFELLFSYGVFPGELRFVAFHSIATPFGISSLKRQRTWGNVLLQSFCLLTNFFFVGSLCKLGHETENEKATEYVCEVRRNNLKRCLSLTSFKT